MKIEKEINSHIIFQSRFLSHDISFTSVKKSKDGYQIYHYKDYYKVLQNLKRQFQIIHSHKNWKHQIEKEI